MSLDSQMRNEFAEDAIEETKKVKAERDALKSEVERLKAELEGTIEDKTRARIRLCRVIEEIDKERSDLKSQLLIAKEALEVLANDEWVSQSWAKNHAFQALQRLRGVE